MPIESRARAANSTKADAVAALATKGITPRGLTRAEAAAYVGLSARTFSARVVDRKLPGPHPITGRWDLRALDAVLDPAAGATTSSGVGTGADGTPVSADALTHELARHTAMIGHPGYTLHGLRHTAASALAEAGASAKEIQAILGHTTLAMSER